LLFLGLALCPSTYFLFGLLDKRFIIPQIGKYILGEVVLDDCKARYHGVDLLRSGLFSHHPEAMLLLVGWLAELA
jgi:hypothetical protein